jgi:DNA-directed RNA polymerase specialized sigma24 family protein
LQAFRSFYESEGQDTITSSDGRSYNLFDIEHLFKQIDRLSPRQAQAIRLCLVNNVLEKEAAKIMGVSETNPVMMYATNGLKRICEMIASGEIQRYAEVEEVAA